SSLDFSGPSGSCRASSSGRPRSRFFASPSSPVGLSARFDLPAASASPGSFTLSLSWYCISHSSCLETVSTRRAIGHSTCTPALRPPRNDTRWHIAPLINLPRGWLAVPRGGTRATGRLRLLPTGVKRDIARDRGWWCRPPGRDLLQKHQPDLLLLG